ncbi:tRNA-specific 2-thiouridylase mnmA [Mesomycoplasma conjunctivae]|uniref:tRNA-specific 2-thiouridylase MnmA n=1 Tax=Mesomycoplasma conjunctivae (strain ATCC 25834 / NCTC 10147 / HRC/581) TaxID=572263 RepID=C5J5Q2_MESCH|nr:tRNA 2-thiouridine(34) synthase MnmA [Mesomycoplasma conjunctivae]CAT04780.1 tRNA-specific 2-thiouridylase mnmA [Mesomycoplasma conjunctivae]VEU65808.1 tRNA-specific 2-thiouridylase mnmA [Mesomycoplasma conjunctivae]
MSRIVVGLSGGVDSSVTAYLLKQQGHEVIAVFMRNWDSTINNDIKGNDSYQDHICPQEKDWLDAQKIAKQLDIPIHRVDFIDEYWNEVFEDLIEKYKNGKTPNPDILCNKNIKFKHFLNYSIEKFKADFIAMGHYAKTENSFLFEAKDENKDQSYFLSQLSNEQLKKVLFPLGDYTKDQVRKIAFEQNLITHDKKDSTGICFIGERRFSDFLQNYIPSQPGNIVDITTQKIVGRHVGAMYFTIGQRKGFGLSGMSQPYFVVGHNLAQKILYVAPQDQRHWLVSNNLLASHLNILNANFNPNNLKAKFRYHQKAVAVQIKIIDNDQFQVYYDDFEAVTPGQEVVIYDGPMVVISGQIEKVFQNQKELDYLS